MRIVLDHEAAWAAHGFPPTGGSSRSPVDPAELTNEQTLVHAWVRLWSAEPQQRALCGGASDPGDVSRWMTRGELDQASTSKAIALISAGFQHGDRIAMSCRPSIDLIVMHVAALRSGLTVVPINTGFTDREVENIVRESGSRVLIADRMVSLDLAEVSVVALDLVGLPQQTEARDELLSRQSRLHTDDPAMLLFTSGTTGKPKGALLSHGNILASAQALVTAWRWTPTDRLILCLPLFHMHGLGVGVHGTLLSGGSAVVLPGFDVDQVLDAARHHQASLLFGVPTMWVRLLASPRVSELQLLRLCVSGSAPLAADVWKDLAAQGHQQIVERYGMTETVMLTSNPLVGDRRAGTVGLPLPGVEVRLDRCGNDSIGEIQVRGPNVFSGYAPPSRSGLDDEGWFATGDLGSIDKGGYLSIVGRSKDLIISGGYNVYPRDVEDVVRSHSSVADCAVVGESNREWGETVTACIILKRVGSIDPELIADLIRDYAATHLANYQRPRRVVILNEFPRNALGKVVKAELLKLIASQ